MPPEHGNAIAIVTLDYFPDFASFFNLPVIIVPVTSVIFLTIVYYITLPHIIIVLLSQCSVSQSQSHLSQSLSLPLYNNATM